MVVEPCVRGGEKRDEHEQAGAGEPVPMSTAAPVVNERPKAGEGDGKILEPGCLRAEPMTQCSGEARNELVFDGWRAHQANVIGPCPRVDEVSGGGGDGEGEGKSGKELVAARDKDPDGKHSDEGKEQVRLESAEPERGPGAEGVTAMEAEKKDQSQEREERSLAHGEADDGGSEGKAEPVDAIWWRAVELVEHADGDEQAGQEEQGPENPGKAQGEKTEGVGDG